MKIRPLRTRTDRIAFHQLPNRLFSNHSAWQPAFIQEVESLFLPANPLFAQGGAAERWLVLDPTNTCVGRIAAFVHPHKAYGFAQPTGGIGFFECVDNQEVANLLFDTARDWLRQQGMAAMDGPINFGENDRFWGLLVAGQEQPPYYGMLWHPVYYQQLFVEYGFTCYYRQFSFRLPIDEPLAPRIAAMGHRALSRPGIEVRFPTPATLGIFAKDFQTIYNEAWGKHDNATPITEAQVLQMAKDLKHVLIPPLMPFAYVNGEPAGFAISIPDMNQMLAPLRGNFPWYQQLLFLLRSRNHLAWYRQRGRMDRARVLVVGVRPAYQRMGLDAAMITAAFDGIRAAGFRELEMGWVGDFNPAMLHLLETLCGPPSKEHQTLRYLFDRSAPAQYAPVIGH